MEFCLVCYWHNAACGTPEVTWLQLQHALHLSTGERAGAVDRWSFCGALEHALDPCGNNPFFPWWEEISRTVREHTREQGGAVSEGRVRKNRDIKSKIQREKQTGLFGKGFRRWRPWAT